MCSHIPYSTLHKVWELQQTGGTGGSRCCTLSHFTALVSDKCFQHCICAPQAMGDFHILHSTLGVQ